MLELDLITEIKKLSQKYELELYNLFYADSIYGTSLSVIVKRGELSADYKYKGEYSIEKILKDYELFLERIIKLL